MADRDEFITINSLELALDGAWVVIDPTVFLGEASYRGQDRIVPGTAGRTARTRVRDSWDVVAQMYVFGKKDKDGLAHADERLGVRDNVETLRSTLLPPYAGDTTTIVHTFSDASTRTGSCIVNELIVAGTHDGLIGHVANVVLDVTVLEGELT